MPAVSLQLEYINSIKPLQSFTAKQCSPKQLKHLGTSYNGSIQLVRHNPSLHMPEDPKSSIDLKQCYVHPQNARVGTWCTHFRQGARLCF